jgi:hypothetical protein
MARQIVEKHQISGVDDQCRGFSRSAELECQESRYLATFRYETVVLDTETYSTPQEALNALIETLTTRGYRQLKSRLSFRGSEYFGSQELWVDYVDSIDSEGESVIETPTEQRAWRSGWIERVLRLFWR